jgi:hypothetical protein
MRRRSLFAILAVFAVSASAGIAQDALKPLFPDIVAVKVQPRGADSFDFDVTMSSPYDTAQRYADAFRIVSKDGKVLGERVLLHDHADEQPFTRELTGVKVPAGIQSVVIQGRDQKSGYGGKTIEVRLPGR